MKPTDETNGCLSVSGHLVGIHVARADDLHRGSVLMMRKKYRQINMTHVHNMCTCAHVHLWCGLKCQKLLIPIAIAFSHGFMACHFPWPWNQMSSRTGCLALCTQFLGLQTYFPCRFPLTRSKLNPNWKCKAWDVPKKRPNPCLDLPPLFVSSKLGNNYRAISQDQSLGLQFGF